MKTDRRQGKTMHFHARVPPSGGSGSDASASGVAAGTSAVAPGSGLKPRRKLPPEGGTQTETASRREVAFGSRRVAFRLYRETRRHLRIVVTPDMKVEVHAPIKADEERVLAAVRARLPWIARTLDRVEQFQPLPTPKRYISGETLLYLGRQYRLRIEAGPREPPKLTGRFLCLTTPKGTPQAAIRRAVDSWYRRRAREVFARSLEKWGAVAQRHGVSDGPWSIRAMRRRWGSCSAAGRITLNTRLVQAPLHCIEYVIVHELCHRKRANHDRGFYSLLGRCLPDWHQRKAVLSRLAV